jgi:hypothetical protein
MSDIPQRLRFFDVDSKPFTSDRTYTVHGVRRRDSSRFPVHQRCRSPGDLNSKISRSLWIPHHVEQELEWRSSRVSRSRLEGGGLGDCCLVRLLSLVDLYCQSGGRALHSLVLLIAFVFGIQEHFAGSRIFPNDFISTSPFRPSPLTGVRYQPPSDEVLDCCLNCELYLSRICRPIFSWHI